MKITLMYDVALVVLEHQNKVNVKWGSLWTFFLHKIFNIQAFSQMIFLFEYLNYTYNVWHESI